MANEIRVGKSIFEYTLFEIARSEEPIYRRKGLDITYLKPFYQTRKMHTFIYPKTHLDTGTITILKAIPSNSILISMAVHVYEVVKGGDILFMDESRNRISLIENLNVGDSGVYTSNSAVNYFVNMQNLIIEASGDISFSAKFLYWRTER